jgi:trimethyllysine dioxygenase
MATITDLEAGAASLAITWGDGVVTTYPWLWLRDHAHDEHSLHPVTMQRQLHTAAIDPAITALDAGVVGDAVSITWAGESRPSVLPVAFLARFRTPAAAAARVDAARELWDAASLPVAASTPWADIMDTEHGLHAWLQQVATYGFAIASGTPNTVEATEALLRRVGYVRETIFGGMWSFTADLKKADTAYTNLELLPHTDGTYSHDAPGLQLLHCLGFVGEGGESTMVDGFRVAAELRERAPEAYRLLSTVAVPGQYIGDGSHLIAARPVLRHDADGRLVQVSYNTADRAPFLLGADEMVAFYDALRRFDELTNDRSLQWRHVLAPGEAMLFDNWRVLHGRTAYTGERTMCGGYVNHEDFESRLRLAESAS